MSSKYKENNFSIEGVSHSDATGQNNIDKKSKPNIDHLLKRIFTERRRQRKNTLVLIFISLLIIFAFYFFQN
jgi:hypothetical protein